MVMPAPMGTPFNNPGFCVPQTAQDPPSGWGTWQSPQGADDAETRGSKGGVRRRRRGTRQTGTPVPAQRTLLIAYFPREASESLVWESFQRFGAVEDVNLIWDMKSRRPRCYGFVRFVDRSAAMQGLWATQNRKIELFDNRGLPWYVKAEWAKDARAAGEFDCDGVTNRCAGHAVGSPDPNPILTLHHQETAQPMPTLLAMPHSSHEPRKHFGCIEKASPDSSAEYCLNSKVTHTGGYLVEPKEHGGEREQPLALDDGFDGFGCYNDEEDDDVFVIPVLRRTQSEPALAPVMFDDEEY